MKSVFITGASSGIGAALARQYAAQGATVGLVARRADLLAQLRQSLPDPHKHKIYPLDVNDHEALATAAEDFIRTTGAVNAVIASAGMAHNKPTGEHKDIAIFAKVINTNLLATVATFTPFIAHMKAHARTEPCRLVGIASIAGVRGLPGSESYSASKAAVISYCESLRLDLRRSGIAVVTIAPGFIQTPMTAQIPKSVPFFMPVDAFAKAADLAIARGDSYRVIPWQMGLPAKLLRWIPNWLYDRVTQNVQLKL
jgi:NAD(P)-dependent dehydrogenase (short-subunit alcohol dehydrogenase family)